MVIDFANCIHLSIFTIYNLRSFSSSPKSCPPGGGNPACDNISTTSAPAPVSPPCVNENCHNTQTQASKLIVQVQTNDIKIQLVLRCNKTLNYLFVPSKYGNKRQLIKLTNASKELIKTSLEWSK